MIHINLIHFGEITNTMQFESKRDAKAAYTKNLEVEGQYTQLYVDGQAYTIAQAREYFGMETGKRKKRPGSRIDVV